MKIGIIGCGKIAEKHIMAYKKLNVKIAVSDVDPKAGQGIAEKYKVEWIHNPEALIKMSEVEAVDVCVPTTHHKKVIEMVLDYGKHFFCEKPLTNSLKEAREIEKRVSKLGVVGMVGYLYRFHPAFSLIKEILNEGIIGKPYFAIFRLGGRGSHKIWKHSKSSGGGVINEMLVHMVDLILWYFGEVKKVKNLVKDIILREREIEGRKIEPDAEDMILLELDSFHDVKIICESDLITPSYMNYAEIQGTNGSIWTSILDYFPTIVYCKEAVGGYNQGNNFFEFPRVNLFEKELSYFLDAIENDKKPDLNSIRDSIKILEVIESIKNR